MNLYPAIDILDGNAVRLFKGDYNKVTIYGKPVETALKWKSQGAAYLHVVDLNGARGDKAKNTKVVEEIVKTCELSVQIGGGIRTMSDIETYLSAGATRVILGSVCLSNPDLVERAVGRFGSQRIICGVDANNGRVAIHGWLEETQQTPIELCRRLKNQGIETVVYTDISRDGTLCGVNVEGTQKLQREVGIDVIASGGVATLEDIAALKEMDIYGVILGKALYEQKFTLSQAVGIAGFQSRSLK